MINFKHKGPKVLLAEGKNDCHVFSALCQHYQLEQNFGFYDCGSDEKVLKRLRPLIEGAEPIETIGVVLDADNPNLKSKWKAIRDRLENIGYSVPKVPNRSGTILNDPKRPRIGIWLMPDNNIDGMLEDFCRKLASSEAIDFAEECVENAKQKGFASFIKNHRSKAVIHTYLAWQKEPGMPMGQAITAKALDGKHPLATEFTDFLKRLFSTET